MRAGRCAASGGRDEGKSARPPYAGRRSLMGSRPRGRRRQPGRAGDEVRTPRRLGRLGAVLEAYEGRAGRSQPWQSRAVEPLPLAAALVTALRLPRCAPVRPRQGTLLARD